MAPGLTLNASTGVITGTPTTATGSPFGFSVTVKDSVGNTSAAQALSITILAAPAITTSSLSNGTVGTIYSQALSASGGVPPYSNWVVSAGTLPQGLTLSASSGIISGIPTTAAGSPFGFSIMVKDSAGNTSVARVLSITILAIPTITASSLLSNGTVGTAYSQTLSANGGTPPYSNWIVSGGALPPGLALNASNGIIRGTPSTAIGSPYNFSVTVKDSAGNTSLAQSFSIAIAAAPGPIISSVSPLSGPAAGGTAVSIFGSNFVSGATVRFGNTNAAVIQFNAGQIAVTSPPGLGTVSVTVTNPDGRSGTLPNAFTYQSITNPTIHATVQPGKISGTVSGVNPPQNFKVVAYAQTDFYYIQPCVTEPLTPIAPDGTWGPIDSHNGTIFALLVSAGYSPPVRPVLYHQWTG